MNSSRPSGGRSKQSVACGCSAVSAKRMLSVIAGGLIGQVTRRNSSGKRNAG